MKLSRDIIYLVIISLLIAVCGQFYYDYQYQPNLSRQVKVHYNKDVQANEKLISVIEDADKFIYFAIYTFTREDIRNALLAAKYKGVEVKGIIDGGQINKIDEQKQIARKLTEAGIPIVSQDHSAIMHLKTLVTDKSYFSGSYNWTKSGTDNNDEVIETGTDDSIRRQYLRIIENLFTKYDK